MLNYLRHLILLLVVLIAPLQVLAATGQEEATLNIPIVIGFILFFVLVSIVITWWTSRSMKSTSDFYVAGKGVPWVQVGIAMTGSYLSAASFLGCAGDIGVYGLDSIWLSIGFFGGYMAVLLLIAGPLRNIGSFTVAGALNSRYNDDRIKLCVMLCTVIISTFYLVPQMLGAGLLFELLLHWNFVWVTIGLGLLMCIYIIFGGMKATLYNQVVQALFLWGTMAVLITLAFFKVGHGNFLQVFDMAKEVVPPLLAGQNMEVVEAIRNLPPDQAIQVARQMMPDAQSAMTIGVKTSSTLAMISTVVALVFGTAGLPHILIMFFTVPSARAAKKKRRPLYRCPRALLSGSHHSRLPALPRHLPQTGHLDIAGDARCRSREKHGRSRDELPCRRNLVDGHRCRRCRRSDPVDIRRTDDHRRLFGQSRPLQGLHQP